MSMFANMAAMLLSHPTHTIKKGDTLYSLAKRHPGVTVQSLLDANPGIDPKKLQIGQKIQFPGSQPEQPEVTQPEKQAPKNAPTGLETSAGMRTALISYLNANEGFESRAYRDVLDPDDDKKITIGYGNTRNPRQDRYLRSQGLDPDLVFTVNGQPISRKQAEAMRDIELDFNEKEFAKRNPWYKKQPPLVKFVLQDMMYNMGPAFNFPNMFKALKAGDLEEAAKEIMIGKYGESDVPNRARRNQKLLLQAAREKQDD